MNAFVNSDNLHTDYVMLALIIQVIVLSFFAYLSVTNLFANDSLKLVDSNMNLDQLTNLKLEVENLNTSLSVLKNSAVESQKSIQLLKEFNTQTIYE